MALCVSCAPPPPLDLPDWHHEAAAVPLGGVFTPPDHEASSVNALRTLGFADAPHGKFERKADMLAHDVLKGSVSEELPGIDAVAVVSVFRPNLKQQYIYPTLRSLLTELPKTMTINVLVGTRDIGYMSQAMLEQEIGPEDIHRVHVIPTPADVGIFFADYPIPVSQRAAWNYSRALRSYTGNSYLMIFEDDVLLARNFATHLRPWLTSPPADGVSLFNRQCNRGTGTQAIAGSSLRSKNKAIKRNSDFPTTQAFLFSAQATKLAGDYLSKRAGHESYDYMIGRIFADHFRHISMLYPSPVQHIGYETTGLSSKHSLPISTCFQEFLP